MKNFLGLTLLEILISLLLLGVILLGMDAMQISGLQQAEANYYYSLASMQLFSLSERLQELDNYQMQPKDVIAEWNQQNQQLLPAGVGIFTIKNTHKNIEIFWGKSHAETCKKNNMGIQGCMHLSV